MRTEDEARVSLEEEFSNDGTCGELSDQGGVDTGSDVMAAVNRIRQRDRDAKAKAQQRKRWKGDRKPLSFIRRVFGIKYPLLGGETWEMVGTSWILSDFCHTFWRCFLFIAVVSVYCYLAVKRELVFRYMTTEVFLGVLITSSMLLVPNISLCLAGPYEDELDAPGLRWVWTFITMTYQVTLTNVVFVSTTYWVLPNISGEQGGALDSTAQTLLHAVSLIGMGGELIFGCIELRATYALVGYICLVVYLAAVVHVHHHATGQWLYLFLSRESVRGAVGAHAAVLCVYSAAVIVVFLAERARREVANWMEGKRRGWTDEAGRWSLGSMSWS